MTTELAQIFAELNVIQYLETFVEQGFDTWETILDITESDFDALGVKLGHRRKIQRRIADSRGISTERALASPTQHTNYLDDRQQLSEDQKTSRAKGEGKDQLALNNGGKRKYRRHPKPDENAPERPPSAYVIFSNKIREDLKHQQLSFTEIAKLVGENWQNLPPSEKEPYESQAYAAKDIYNNALAEYKKTENYRNYQAYLAEFKAKQSSNQQADAESAKRPKLEERISNDSSGNGSSSATSQTGADTPVTRKRVHSNTSSTSMPWYGNQNPSATPSAPASNTGTTKLYSVKSRNSPVAKSPRVLPGYRDSLTAPLLIRDSSRDTDSDSFQQPQQQPSAHQQQSHQQQSQQQQSHQQQPQQHSNVANIQRSRGRVNESHISPFGTMSVPPPMLTHDSTVESASSGSSSVGPMFTPRTPMELEQRTSPFPNLFPSKLPGFFDNHQLPPLRPPSLSPQSSVNTGYQSPQGIVPTIEYTGQTQAQHSLRNYQHISNQNQQAMQHIPQVPDAIAISQQHGIPTGGDNGDLDPVSALLMLKAGETAERNARRQTQHPSE